MSTPVEDDQEPQEEMTEDEIYQEENEAIEDMMALVLQHCLATRRFSRRYSPDIRFYLHRNKGRLISKELRGNTTGEDYYTEDKVVLKMTPIEIDMEALEAYLGE